MNVIEECLECQIKNASKIISKIDIDEKEKNVLIGKVKTIASKYIDDNNPLFLARGIYQEMKKFFDVEVFFEYQKNKTNKIAEKFLEKFKPEIENSDNVLFEKLKFSILGNIIDYGIPEQSTKDFNKEFEQLDNYAFGINHFDSFLIDLKEAESAVYLADNSGEIIFDIYFIEHIKKYFPGIDIILGVRSDNVLNDVTLKDVNDLGYSGKIMETGSVYPGTMTGVLNPDFKKKLENADLVISKGQGNFEGLYKNTYIKVYFAFVAKCDYVANSLGVDKGNLIFMKQT